MVKHLRASGSVVVLMAQLAAWPLAAQEFQVNTYTSGTQRWPAIAMAPTGEFVVAWESQSNSDSLQGGIMTRRFAADGTALDAADLVVNTEAGYVEVDASVSMRHDGTFVVGWGQFGVATYPRVLTRSFPFDGSSLAAGDLAHGDPPFESTQLAQAVNGEHTMTVYDRLEVQTATESIQAEFGQVNAFSGSMASPEPSLAGDGSLVVTWTSLFSPTGNDDSEESIQARRFDPAGTPHGVEFQVNSHTVNRQGGAEVAHLADDSFVVVWHSATSAGTDSSGYSIQARRFAADGLPLGTDFQVNTYTTGTQQDPVVAADTIGNFVVVWSSQGSPANDTSGLSVQAQVFTAAGNRLGPEFQVNLSTLGYQYQPDVATDADGHFRVVWTNDVAGGPEDGPDIRSRERLSFTGIFADGFESGDTLAWTFPP